MNEFEKALIKYLGADNLEKIQRIKVGICGAGGNPPRRYTDSPGAVI